MYIIKITKLKSLVLTLLLLCQPILGLGVAWAQVQPEHKITEIQAKGLCGNAAAAKDTTDHSMNAFQNNIRLFFEVSGLDKDSNKSYNIWWEKYYKDVVCDIKEEQDMFGDVVQKAEKRTLLQHTVLERNYKNIMDMYDDYFKEDMRLNINIIGFDGQTITSWLDKKIEESSGSDKAYFIKTQEHFIKNYGAKRTEELEKKD